ncbi:PDZ domain-containing protein [Novosphingobium profundi]|uniref:M48 family metallopeptidase n=1 Tax=Novosphingobium profundi TaxID=1774954 RepID=UPI001BDB52CB|nr:M48 family metallopeptidase [Novosphingobium profundi]MBT0668346.1 PDZ domain-containing protein [Novosphingobium profundi]
MRKRLVLFLMLFVSSRAYAATDEQWPAALQNQMIRLTTIGYHLTDAAKTSCAPQEAASGLVLDYINAYPEEDRALVARVTGLRSDPQVIGTVPGSPADSSGLKAGDAIVAINGRTLAQFRENLKDPDLLGDALEQALLAEPAGQPFTLSVTRNDRPLRFEITPRHSCAVRFLIKFGEGENAFTDGVNVAIGASVIDHATSDDQIALVAAHELAHILNHDRKATGLGDRRNMERRADILGGRIARCAGYSLEDGMEYLSNFNHRDWLRFFRDPSHPSTSSRLKALKADAGSVECPPRL